MYVGNENTTTQTLISYTAPLDGEQNKYAGVSILFADDFDMSTLPKSVRAHKLTRIHCSPSKGNVKNEAGIKRLRRILKALEGHNVKVLMPYANSVTEDDFFAFAG